jgi:hypothetical protein
MIKQSSKKNFHILMQMHEMNLTTNKQATIVNHKR